MIDCGCPRLFYSLLTATMSSHTSNQIIPDSFDKILPETIIGNISEKNMKGVGELQLDHTNELSEDARKNRVGILNMYLARLLSSRVTYGRSHSPEMVQMVFQLTSRVPNRYIDILV